MEEIKRGKTQVRGFQSEEMDFQLMRQLGSTAHGGASPGECLAAAAQIKDGDPEAWVREFAKRAAWQQSDAEERAKKGHAVSARDQFFKACNSYRAAEYYTSPRDPRHRELGLKSRACFLEAMKYVAHTFEAAMIPYKNIELPIYLMTPARETRRRKTLLIVSGFDGTLEEEYLMHGLPALQRGYNVLHFAGPGQMDLFRFFSDTHFEPDFENVTRTVVDYALARPEVDPEKLALMGISLGGYFSVRSAAHEPRIRALIPNSPILNLHDYLSAFIGYDPAEIPDERNFTVEELWEIPEDLFPREDKARTDNLIVRYGQKSFRDTFIYLRQFVVGEALANIRCPCLALVGSGEGGEPEKQFQEFVKGVPGPVAQHRFTEAEGADSHCQVGNPSYAAAVALDWLDEVLG